MADYYPLIARAIAGLDPGASGESRRALYERARTALIAQLRNVQPPLSETEITRERLALEEAVRKVEQEAALRSRGMPSRPARTETAPPEANASEAEASETTPSPSRPGDALRDSARAAAARAAQQQPPSQIRDRPPGRPDRTAPDEKPSRNLRTDEARLASRQLRQDARSRNGGKPDSLEQLAREARRPSEPPPGQGVRGFRDVVADADDLGRATSQANRLARDVYQRVPSSEDDRRAPRVDQRESQPYSYDESVEEAARYQPTARATKGTRAPTETKKRSGGFPIKSALAVAVALIVIGAIILLAPKFVSLNKSFTKSPPAAESMKDAEGARPKITDRVGQPSSAQQIAPVAQRVVLYDEDPAEPQGKQYIGSVVWRTEQIKGTNGQPDLAVRADIDIPDRKFKMSMTVRRNTDASLPASHTAELTFTLPPDFAGGTVSNVPGLLMKSNEQTRGTPLAGLAVKVTDGFFLVGLSNVDADRVRNMQLLKERSWFDIPLVYANQRRAIIAIEKGAPGERAFADAFAAWDQQ